jgi:methionyl-tRNA synthetase
VCVKNLWKKLDENGFITQGRHEGFYSVNDECFIPQIELEEKDGKFFT